MQAVTCAERCEKIMSCIVWKLQIVLTARNKHRHLIWEVEIKLYTKHRFIWWVCEELVDCTVSPMEIKAPAHHS